MEMVKIVQTWQYDNLPAFVFTEKTILEIGSGSGKSQYFSKYRKYFLNDNRYTGIDIIDYPDKVLNIIQEGLFETQRTADTVLCIHVLEHFPINQWEEVIKKLKSMTNNNGYLVVQVPFNEKLENYIKRGVIQRYQQLYTEERKNNYHLTFGITKKVLEYFLPDSQIIIHRTPIIFTNPLKIDEKLLWKIGRFIKRLFTFHPFVWNGIMGKKWAITAIFQKRDD